MLGRELQTQFKTIFPDGLTGGDYSHYPDITRKPARCPFFGVTT